MSGDVQNVCWNMVEELGHGGFGSVWKERCVEGPQYMVGRFRAVKSTPKHHQVAWQREVEALKRFSQYDDLFVQFLGQSQTDHTLLLYMEFIPHGTLQGQITRRGVPDEQAANITKQIARALQCMHRENFIHRDLKPLNVLVNRPGPDWHVKVADFGISKNIAEETGASVADQGTWAFMAPEIMAPGARSKKIRYTPAVDIWALGATTHCILTGQAPFGGDRHKMSDYSRSLIPFPKTSGGLRRCSGLSVDFITTAMTVDKDVRPVIDKILLHEWLNDDFTDSDSSCFSSRPEDGTSSNAWAKTWYPEQRQDITIRGSPQGAPESKNDSDQEEQHQVSEEVVEDSQPTSSQPRAKVRDNGSATFSPKATSSSQTSKVGQSFGSFPQSPMSTEPHHADAEPSQVSDNKISLPKLKPAANGSNSSSMRERNNPIWKKESANALEHPRRSDTRPSWLKGPWMMASRHNLDRYFGEARRRLRTAQEVARKSERYEWRKDDEYATVQVRELEDSIDRCRNELNDLWTKSSYVYLDDIRLTKSVGLFKWTLVQLLEECLADSDIAALGNMPDGEIVANGSPIEWDRPPETFAILQTDRGAIVLGKSLAQRTARNRILYERFLESTQQNSHEWFNRDLALLQKRRKIILWDRPQSEVTADQVHRSILELDTTTGYGSVRAPSDNDYARVHVLEGRDILDMLAGNGTDVDEVGSSLGAVLEGFKKGFRRGVYLRDVKVVKSGQVCKLQAKTELNLLPFARSYRVATIRRPNRPCSACVAQQPGCSCVECANEEKPSD